MWSTRRRLSEASHCSIMWRLWLPAAFGSSSSIAPCTLVASTIVSRLPLRSSAFPTASSLAPVLYTFAVSRKFTPPDGAIDDVRRVLFARAAPEHHAPEAELADLHAGSSEVPVLHAALLRGRHILM